MPILNRDIAYVLHRSVDRNRDDVERYLILLGYDRADIQKFMPGHVMVYWGKPRHKETLSAAVLADIVSLTEWEWTEIFPGWSGRNTAWEAAIICVTMRRLVYDGYTYQAIENATGKTKRVIAFHVEGHCCCDNRHVFPPLRKRRST